MNKSQQVLIDRISIKSIRCKMQFGKARVYMANDKMVLNYKSSQQ